MLKVTANYHIFNKFFGILKNNRNSRIILRVLSKTSLNSYRKITQEFLIMFSSHSSFISNMIISCWTWKRHIFYLYNFYKIVLTKRLEWLLYVLLFGKLRFLPLSSYEIYEKLHEYTCKFSQFSVKYQYIVNNKLRR